jgi:hypothetical protein
MLMPRFLDKASLIIPFTVRYYSSYTYYCSYFTYAYYRCVFVEFT